MDKIIIDLIGDPLIDYWNNGEKINVYLGGAANVEQNLVSLLIDNHLSKDKIDLNVAFSSPWIYGEKFDPTNLDVGSPELYPAKLYLVDLDDKTWNTTNAPGHPFNCAKVPISENWIYQDIDEDTNKNILVVSDYNKGFTNNNLKSLIKDKYYDFCIVDSRYGNTDFSFLRDHSECLIWRQTKRTDANIEFQYDYKIETDADNPIYLKDYKNEVIICLPSISPKEVISTCGAGDVFTASVAASIAVYYSNKQEKDLDLLSKGLGNLIEEELSFQNLLSQTISFAQLACWEAISYPHTCTVKNIKL